MTTRDITTRPTGQKKITDDEAIVLVQKESCRYLALPDSMGGGVDWYEVTDSLLADAEGALGVFAFQPIKIEAEESLSRVAYMAVKQLREARAILELFQDSFND